MPEPMDTIRRVNGEPPMNLVELYQARTVLDSFARDGKTDVLEARRRVQARIRELNPDGHESQVGGPGTRTSAGSRSVTSVTAPAKDASKPTGNPVVGFIVLLVIVGVLFYACKGGGGGDGDSSGGGGGGRSEGMAKVMCENFVEDRLKAPGTADFSGIFDTDITGSGTSYTVRGYVDAQNSFGAKLRSNYTCVIEDQGNDKWSLVSLTGLN